MKLSPLQIARYSYNPKLPGMLRNGISEICVKEGNETTSVADQEKIKSLFPNTYGKKEITFAKGTNTSISKKQIVGVILSGGQAPGGHNVISGLYDALKATNKENELYGFLGGPSGLIEDKYIVFNDEYINQYRNTGGFDIIGSGRTKLETKEQFAIVSDVCKKHGITAVVIIGGDDSNTNAAVLAEYFAANNTGVQVIGCPKTIDGDLKNEDIECSFGFDTATKTYSELIGNIERDANSAKKYWQSFHITKYSPQSAALTATPPITAPYFINLENVIFIPFLRKRFDHIMPASAPMGVRHAPKLEPITVAYTAAEEAPPERMAEYNTLIGMLLIRYLRY